MMLQMKVLSPNNGVKNHTGVPKENWSSKSHAAAEIAQQLLPGPLR